MAGDRIKRLKVTGLVIGCCAKFVTGSVFVFNVYQGYVKDTFNYTQKQVEVLSSMMNIGLGFGFLPGMFYDRFGPCWASTLGLAVALVAHGLIYSTTRAPGFYARNFGFMALYFFLSGLGSVFMYMVALNTNAINFDKRHAGAVIGLLNAMFAGSQVVFPLIYYHLFTYGDITDTGHQNFPGFILMLIVCYTIVGLLCVFFLRIHVPDDLLYTPLTEVEYQAGNDIRTDNDGVKPDTSSESSQEQSMQIGAGSAIDSSEQRLSVCEILRNVDYQLILWMFGFASCIGLVYTNNITVVSQSVHLDHFNDRLTIIIPIASSVLSIVIGVLSDRFRERLPRTALLMIACILFFVSQILVATFADVLTFLVIATLAVGLGLAVLWSITPTVMRENFNARNLGRNWGMAIFMAAFLNLGAQESFGALYDAQVSGVGELNCYGMRCIRGGAIVLVVLALISVVFAVAIQVKSRCLGNGSSRT